MSLDKTFKVAVRDEGIRDIPYKSSFRHFGELFVLHKRITALTYEQLWPDGRREVKPCKPSNEWECSHYKTGTRVPVDDHPFNMSASEERAKKLMDKAGKDAVMEGVKKLPVLNVEEPELGSLFEEEDMLSMALPKHTKVKPSDI